GAEVACLFKEEEVGMVRVSLRSKGPCDVDRVAQRFGGGGHAKAAGCSLAGSLAEAKALILEAVVQALGAVATEVARG
ncbi:MAG: DHHA1 domain-containing protein, partial [Nitrospinota bacterium]